MPLNIMIEQEERIYILREGTLILIVLLRGKHRLEDLGFEILEPLKELEGSRERFPEFRIPAAEHEEEQQRETIEYQQIYEQDPTV